MTLISKSDWRVSLDQESLLRRIINRIRQTLELDDIITTTTTQMRSLLGTDRVMIYKFHADGSGQVIAESIYENRLPSLIGLNFPADDIPSNVRELLIKSRVRSVINTDTNQICQIHLNNLDTGESTEDIRYRTVDPCHVKYLNAMGVKSTVVAPILHQDTLWGLLVSHNSEPSSVSEYELEAVQIVVDQLAVAIAQSNLLTQAREKAAREAIINRVATLLHSLPAIELQPALEEVMTAFSASGSRLCIRNSAFNVHKSTVRSLTECLESGTEEIRVYTCGQQPIIPVLEQYLLREENDKSGKYDIWAISDISHHPSLQNVQVAFHSTKIRSILVIPLHHRQLLVGLLSIFRDEIDTETLWAGQFDSDQRQVYPRASFELWRETKKAQAREWTTAEIELAQALSQQFALAIQQYELYQQVQVFNAKLENQVQERTTKLQQAVEQQHLLFEIVTKMRESLDMESIFQTTTGEIRRVLNADRVAVYRFQPGSKFNDGEFIIENVLPEFPKALAAKIHDECFGENFAEKYRQGRVRVVSDIHNAGMQDCHVEVLNQFQVRAKIIMPLLKTGELWGLLCIHQCGQTRNWENAEIQFVIQIANQLGVALEQADLLAQTKQQTIDLQQAAAQQQVLFEVVAKMRQSLDINTIFATMSKEVRQALNADRVAVYRFDPDSEFNEGEFIVEDVLPDFPVALTAKIRDRCFGEHYAQKYSQGRINAVADIHNGEFQECYVAIFDQFQVKANINAPVIKGNQLWGLLCIHQCSQPRQWQTSEIQFATQIANQLGVALEQADLLAQTQQQAQQLTSALRDLQEAQTQLIQTEKMSSLGQLVAGIAHEINNPVNFIYGNLAHVSEYADDLLGMLELYQQHSADTSPEIWQRAEEIDLEFLTEDLPKTLASMKIGIDRIRQIVLGLRNFSRLDEAEMKAVNIHEGIDSTLLILQHRLKARPESPAIKLVKNYGDLPLVECYAGQLNQVFMNVLSNAIDALEDEEKLKSASRSPQITINTSLGEIKGNVKSVVIRIADNGPGIPEAVKTRICDPFFTTKPVGKGTGLGLSISYKIIVDKHGGIFKCDSQSGVGSEFWMEIPLQHLR